MDCRVYVQKSGTIFVVAAALILLLLALVVWRFASSNTLDTVWVSFFADACGSVIVRFAKLEEMVS